MLGGGDGLALREIFKYPEVRKATLVDLDPKVVDLARTNPELAKLNEGALNAPRVHGDSEHVFGIRSEGLLEHPADRRSRQPDGRRLSSGDSGEVARGMFVFAKDMLALERKINTLVNPVILDCYAKSWTEW